MRRPTVVRLCTMVSKRTPPEELITSACHPTDYQSMSE